MYSMHTVDNKYPHLSTIARKKLGPSVNYVAGRIFGHMELWFRQYNNIYISTHAAASDKNIV